MKLILNYIGAWIPIIVVFICPLGVTSDPEKLTVINDLRDFKPLAFEDHDYFVSNKPATAENAAKACASIGNTFHLVTFENETEFRKLLPYFRSLEIPKLWTSGIKIQKGNNAPEYMWTSPSPSFPMNFTNFPSASMLAKLNRIEPSRMRMELPRCKNGFLLPKCDPGKCNITLDECITTDPICSVTSQAACHIVRPDCGASCNNCTIQDPVCHFIQEPCNVMTPPCKPAHASWVIKPPHCETTRPPCYTINPTCDVTTPLPCTTTRRPCHTTHESCTTTQPPCTSDGKCPPPVTFCKDIFTCEPEPIICQPGAIICPSPTVICPPEQTTCTAPTLEYTKPNISCPELQVDCPKPEVRCLPPVITCEAPEISCPGIFINCPPPKYTCSAPQSECPHIKVECDEMRPCEYPNPPLLCPDGDVIDESEETSIEEEEIPITSATCDNCLPSGCLVLRKDTDFKWKIQNCSDKFHFVCEGH